jgi:hypothetical protein
VSEKHYLCSVNPRLINKNDRDDLGAFSEGFIQSSLTQANLISLISRGVALSYVFKDERREAKGFLGTEVLAVDIDGLLTIDEVCGNSLVTGCAGFVYTTPSHTAESPRLRVVFFLEEGIQDPEDLRKVSTALALRLSGDLAATDPARIFYGSTNCQVFNFGKELPKNVMQELITQGSDALKARSLGNHSGMSTWSSSRQLSDDLVVKTRRGDAMPVSSINKNTTIYCPDHFDTNPSAFVGVTARGSRFIYCHVCQTTRWLSKRSSSNSFCHFGDTVIDFYSKGDYQTNEVDTPFGPVSEKTLVGGQIHISNERHFSIKQLRSGLTFVKSPKGSGKTTMMLDVLQPFTEVIKGGDLSLLFLEENEDLEAPPLYQKTDTKFSVLLIGHRQALIRELCKRLNLNCYLDDIQTAGSKAFTSTGQSRRHQYERQRRYGVCLDSLNIVQQDSYDLVILDESEQVLGHFLSETMSSRRQHVFRRFNTLVRESKRVVCLDADLSWISFMTLTDLAYARSRDWSLQDQSTSTNQSFPPNKQVHVFINQYSASGRRVEVYDSKQHLIGDMDADIKAGRKVFFTSNSKKQVDRLAGALGEKFPDKQILKVTSENSNSEHIQSILLAARTKLPEFDVVLTSPSLSTGIDLTFDNEQVVFEVVYGIFQPLVNTHFEIDQQLSRVRQTHHIRCWISPESFAFEDDLSVVSIELFKQNLEANTYSSYQPIDWEELNLNSDSFIRMGSLILSQQRASMNLLRTNFVEYKRRQGVEVVIVAKNETSRKSGKAVDDQGMLISLQKRVAAILDAEPIDQRTFIEISELIRNSKSVEENLLRSYERHRIEFFNRGDISEEDVSSYVDGRHGKVRLLESLLTLHAMPEETDQGAPSIDQMRRDRVLDWLKTRDLKLKIDQPIDLRAYVWGEIFATTPIFREGRFTGDEFASSDLAQMIEVVDTYRWVFDTFLIKLRGDLRSNPVRFLGDRLREVGLELINHKNDQAGGKKIYYYKLGEQTWFKTVSSSSPKVAARVGQRGILQIIEDRRHHPSSSYIPQYWTKVHAENGFNSQVYERVLDGDARHPKPIWIPWAGDLEKIFKEKQVNPSRFTPS